MAQFDQVLRREPPGDTLVDAHAERQAGDDAGHCASLEYVLARQTSLGLLPEQVTRDGEPAWVVPLGWSHAMLILAARPELALVRDGA